jgi:hypothetical protein
MVCKIVYRTTAVCGVCIIYVYVPWPRCGPSLYLLFLWGGISTRPGRLNESSPRRDNILIIIIFHFSFNQRTMLYVYYTRFSPIETGFLSYPTFVGRWGRGGRHTSRINSFAHDDPPPHATSSIRRQWLSRSIDPDDTTVITKWMNGIRRTATTASFFYSMLWDWYESFCDTLHRGVFKVRGQSGSFPAYRVAS